MPPKRKREEEFSAPSSSSSASLSSFSSSTGSLKRSKTEDEMAGLTGLAKYTRMHSFKSEAYMEAKAATNKRSSGVGRSAHVKSIKQLMNTDANATSHLPPNFPTYARIAAEPSAKPLKKYCDITGLLGKYTAPLSHLRYNHSSLYPLLKELPLATTTRYLQLRNAYIAIR